MQIGNNREEYDYNKRYQNLEELSVYVTTNILIVATLLKDNLYQRLEKQKVIQKK